MPIQTDHLFNLIKTLTKSEKRNFKLYVNRIGGKENAKFIQLFDVLEKQSEYDEDQICIKIPSIKKAQVSNLKRHLYRQLLISLRLIHIQRNIDIEIREQLDFAKILYNKGLYLQSLKLLDRIKSIAYEYQQDSLHLEIIEFEKYIESGYITRSMETRADNLSEESEKRIRIIQTTGKLSNLSLRLYGLYIKTGHTRNQKDAYIVSEFFKSNLPVVDINKLTFYEKVYFYQSHVWYNYILQDFLKCYSNARRGVGLFEKNPQMIRSDPSTYLKGYNNLLATLFYIGDHPKFKKSLESFGQVTKVLHEELNTNGKLLCFQYLQTAQINGHFIEGTFKEGVRLIPEIETGLENFKYHLDQHRVMVFYYKIACMYFGANQNDKALDYLNKIINFKAGALREDIQCFARILHLICHYELGNIDLLEYIIKSVYRFLAKMEDLNMVQTEVLKFLRKALYLDKAELRKAFLNLKNKLEILSSHPYEKRSFLYLDIISWLESKLSNKHIGDIIREKFLKKNEKHE
ncbi:MAG: hypothetical protein ACI81W_003052 [Saprospiraceae bacterium]|jgi:hypothetical protein